MASQLQWGADYRGLVRHKLGRPAQHLQQLHLQHHFHPQQPLQPPASAAAATIKTASASATAHCRESWKRPPNSRCSLLRVQFLAPCKQHSLRAVPPTVAAAAYWGLLASTTLSSSSTAASAVAPATFASLLTSWGIFILCSAAAAFLVCAIPTLWAAARLAHQATAVLHQVEKELPETAALIRLSGLEVTDCVTELTGLGSDLSQGVRSTAKLITVTETGVKQALAVGQSLPPVLAAKETEARGECVTLKDKDLSDDRDLRDVVYKGKSEQNSGALEAGLRARANIKNHLPEVAQAAKQATGMVQRLRLGLAIAGAATNVVRLGQAVRGRAQLVAQQYIQTDDEAPSLPIPRSKQ